jgi:hypothetical protein
VIAAVQKYKAVYQISDCVASGHLKNPVLANSDNLNSKQ